MDLIDNLSARDFDNKEIETSDYGLIEAEKLSIPEVLDKKEGIFINSRDFFSQNEEELILWRRSLQEAYRVGRPRFICPECEQPVKISGHKLARGKVCYFAHFKDSDDCQYKTGSGKTKEEIERKKYSLVQESERHKRLKAGIVSALEGGNSKSKGVTNVECEKRINSEIPYLNWRRPDIYMEYDSRKFVFELQLSTTFISIIVDRDIFYRLNNYNVIWIFNFEDNQEYVNLHNLMCKDIYYANKRNVFIFDSEAEKKSKEQGELVLKCRWLDENGIWSSDKYITLDKLLYDEESHKPFIFDADKAYLEKYPEYVEKRKELEHSREYLLKALMERQKQEEEYEKEKAKERSMIQLKLLNEDKSVERFRSGTKYGYQYEGVIVLPAKYTYAEDIRKDGYAKVGFNKKFGLIRKDGREIVPVGYRNIDVINSQHGIIMATYERRIILWLGNESFILDYNYIDNEQRVVRKDEDGITEYILENNYYCSRSTLFSMVEKKDFCVICLSGRMYSLSKNRLQTINDSCSDVKPTSIDQIFLAKDLNTHLWGIVNLQDDISIDFKYANLIPSKSKYLIAQYTCEHSPYGLIDYHGREFIKPQYEAFFYLNSEKFAFCREGHLWGICDHLGNILHEAEYTYIRATSSGIFKASTLKSYLKKWRIKDSIPLYSRDDIRLCLLNEKGDIVYTEQYMGEYQVRLSGELYSIFSLENKEIVDYSLSSVEFITKTIALIKDTEGRSGLFIDDKCVFFNECRVIEYLGGDRFKFENNHKEIAIGNSLGPVSVFFSEICEFENGFARAIYHGRKGVIDEVGAMQEKIINIYGNYKLCERFEKYFFRNEVNEVVSNEYQSIEHLVDIYFIVKDYSGVGLFSLDTKTATNTVFHQFTHLTEDIFIAEKFPSINTINIYQLYKSTRPATSKSYSSIVLLDNGYIAVQKSRGKRNVKYLGWNLLNKEGESINDVDYDSIIDANDESFKVCINGREGLIDLYGNAIVEKKVCENNYVLTCFFGDYGLEDSKGNVILPLKEHFSAIEFIGYEVVKVCRDNKYALYSTKGIKITEHKFTSITYETNNRYEVVENNIKGYIDSHGNYIESSAVPITKEGITIFVKMENYGLRDANGNIIIPSEYACIEYLIRRLLRVKKESSYALFDLDGRPLTEFIYSDISNKEDGFIQATRNNCIGGLDDNGNEIAYIVHFNGGYLQSFFGDYSVINDANEIIIPTGYSKIELLGSDGIFALWVGSKIAVGTILKEKTEPIYESIRSIGHGFYVVSRTISKKIKIRNVGYGYRGNPYTYYTSKVIEDNKYGIIDSALRTIIPCIYSSISNFDSEQNIIVINAKGEKKSISLHNLKQKASYVSILSIDMEYDAKVQSFMDLGLIVKVQGKSFLIHKKHLFKDKRKFRKGELLTVKFLGNDENGHPVWNTRKAIQTDQKKR